MIKCNRCAKAREAVARAILGAAAMIDTQTDKLRAKNMATMKAQKTRSGDEWEVVNARNVVLSTGFDDEAEAEEWIKQQKKRKPK